MMCVSAAEVADVPFTVAAEPWRQVHERGYHRAVVSVEEAGPAVRVTIPWRRRDPHPEHKAVIVVDAQTGAEVVNAVAVEITRERGVVAFEPTSGAGRYELYYLPIVEDTMWGGYQGGYVRPRGNAGEPWLKGNGLTKRGVESGRWRELPEAHAERIEARSAFHSFFPMEIIATAKETAAFSAKHEGTYLVFPEDRRYPIRMRHELPLRWIEKGPRASFAGTVKRNEYYAFQLGIYAASQGLEDLRLSFGGLSHEAEAAAIAASALNCINFGGTDWDGKPLRKRVDVPKGTVQALWVGIQVPKDAAPGAYTGCIEVRPANAAPQAITVKIAVEDEVLKDHGDGEPWKHSRLRWLDSTLGADGEVVPPYTPLDVDEHTIRCLGREVVLGESGLPISIRAGGYEVLGAPMALQPDTAAGAVALAPRPFDIVQDAPGRAVWEATSESERLQLTCRGRMEFDGHVHFALTLEARQDMAFADVRLCLPATPYASEYFMGIGRGGGLRPAEYDWKWTGPYDSFWLGNTHAGVHCELRGGAYHGPMLNLYKPAPPKAWSNGGEGGCRVRDAGEGALVEAYTGARALRAGEQITFEFALLVTPVKPLDTRKHFENRYYHSGGEPEITDELAEAKVNVINIHHANHLNPYINYPFVETEVLKEFVDAQHAEGRAVKIYYTIRELSNYVPEMFALRSLGHEIFTGGGGGGFPWLREHLAEDYAPSWYSPIDGGEADASIVTTGLSRWCNYYVEGLRWLAENLGIDGLYLDDVTYDRSLLQRMRKALAGANPNAMLDLHSNTGFSVGPANQYAEFFPYVDRLWFGESFRYNEMSPDQWLVEVSGIPFGLMGTMLHAGGNQWLGPVFGMNTRLGWVTENVACDPRNVWTVYDEFGIADAEMVGYWEEGCPVGVSGPALKATAYIKPGKTLIALGNFGSEPATCAFTIDWKRLGLVAEKAYYWAPEAEGFQPERRFTVGEGIPIEPKRGWLLILQHE